MNSVSPRWLLTHRARRAALGSIAALALTCLPASGERSARAAASRTHAPPPPITRATFAPADTGASYAAFLSDLAALAVDSTRVAQVASVVIEREAGVFALEQGTLALCRPGAALAGRVCAAVFTGRGTFVYSPTSEIERDRIIEYDGHAPLRRPFTMLVLLFSDTTRAELEAVARFVPGAVPQAARLAIREAVSFIVPTELKDVPVWLAKPLLDPVHGGLFYAHVQGPGKPLFFALDPGTIEGVRLLRRPDDDYFGVVVYHHLEVLSQQRRRGDTLSTEGDLWPSLRIAHQAIDVTVAPDLACEIGVTLNLESLEPGQRWLPLTFGGKGTVDSVMWADGTRPRIRVGRESGVIWVRCDPPLDTGSMRALRLHYHARLFERDGDLFFNQIPDGWYPVIDGETPATFDLAFHYPDQYQLAATGRRVADETRGGVRHTRYTVDPATPWVSFDIGLFHVVDATADSLPPIHVLVAGGQHAGDSELLRGDGRSIEQRVAAEVRDEARFFRRAVGPVPDRPLYAVHTTDNVLRAYPQLIHLPLTFHRHIDPDITPYFYRAHEVAHQWWGLSVRPRNYHDAWMSEGFADFFAAWFVQNSTLGTPGYLDILGAWRRRILDNRKFLFGKAAPAAPIALGDRTNSSRTVGDYDVIVYNKGAWVLHMLRNLMLTDDDPSELRFGGLWREFYTAHAGGTASTLEFRAAAERAAGQDLGWFFSQWIDHAEIPTYTFSYHVAQNTDGRWVVKARVAQSRVPSTFRMDVPIRLEYGGGRSERLRVRVTGPLTEFELPATDAKPVRVEFNDLESVLCEVVQAAWK